MNWKVLKTEEDYKKASMILMEIFHAEPNTSQSDELDLLMVLIKDYDDKHNKLPELDIESLV
jgi:HTH-type transcriptional regulator/antitoxin HigA